MNTKIRSLQIFYSGMLAAGLLTVAAPAMSLQASLRSRDTFWDIQAPKTPSIFDGH
jgi:hypothetical protein